MEVGKSSDVLRISYQVEQKIYPWERCLVALASDCETGDKWPSVVVSIFTSEDADGAAQSWMWEGPGCGLTAPGWSVFTGGAGVFLTFPIAVLIDENKEMKNWDGSLPYQIYTYKQVNEENNPIRDTLFQIKAV